jgi:hypothetical protein
MNAPDRVGANEVKLLKLPVRSDCCSANGAQNEKA